MATKVSVVALSSYSRGFHFAINCWQSIVVRYLVPGPVPCPEVVAVFYIRLAEVLTLSSVEREAQVKRQNTAVGFLTPMGADPSRIQVWVLTYEYPWVWIQVYSWVHSWTALTWTRVHLTLGSDCSPSLFQGTASPCLLLYAFLVVCCACPMSDDTGLY